MKKGTLFADGRPLVAIRKAEGKERREGLLPYDAPPDWGMLLSRCPSVHTFGMSFAIDVVFLRRGRVVSLFPSLRPGRVCSAFASQAVELPEGSVARFGISKGQRLDVLLEDS